MAYWLFKSEPDAYAIDDLARDGSELWDGIRNYQARNFMTKDMRVGDGVVFYHSSCATPAAVGTASVNAVAVPDPTQFMPDSPYYDPASSPEAPRWWCVSVAFEEKFAAPVPLVAMRQTPALADMQILKRGNRLSITPLTGTEWNTIRRLGRGGKSVRRSNGRKK